MIRARIVVFSSVLGVLSGCSSALAPDRDLHEWGAEGTSPLPLPFDSAIYTADTGGPPPGEAEPEPIGDGECCSFTKANDSIESQIYSRGNNDPNELYTNYVQMCLNGLPAPPRYEYETGRVEFAYHLDASQCICTDGECTGMMELQVDGSLQHSSVCAPPEDPDDDADIGPCDPGYRIWIETGDGDSWETDVSKAVATTYPGDDESQAFTNVPSILFHEFPCDVDEASVRVYVASERKKGDAVDPTAGPQFEGDNLYAVILVEVGVEITDDEDDACRREYSFGARAVEVVKIAEGFAGEVTLDNPCCPDWDPANVLAELQDIKYTQADGGAVKNGHNALRLWQQNGEWVGDPFYQGPDSPNAGDTAQEICNELTFGNTIGPVFGPP